MKSYRPSLQEVKQRYCDGLKLHDWILDSKRKPARVAFTQGMERRVAYAFESIFNTVKWENMRLRGALEEISLLATQAKRDIDDYGSIARRALDK